MAPRTGRRVGVTRMDAAIDFVTQMGYPSNVVRAKMVDLLKVYGGDVGYPFIEADCYKVLLDAIIEEEDSKREKASVVKTPNSCGPSTSIESVRSQTPNTLNDTGGGNRWKDIVLDKIRSPVNRNGTEAAADNDTEQEELMRPIPPCEAPFSPPLIAATSPPPPPPPARRRKPCYGWISDDEDGEEEEDSVMLTPMEGLSSSGGDVIRRPTRRSRWDLRPEDM